MRGSIRPTQGFSDGDSGEGQHYLRGHSSSLIGFAFNGLFTG